MLKRLDEYYLNMPVREVFELKELTPEEYAMFETAGVRMLFSEERMYHGRNILFASAVCKTVIGTSEGMIYRIAAQTGSLEKEVCSTVFGLTYRFLSREMGPPGPGATEEDCGWDSEEGNVILEKARAGEAYLVQICLTSSLIRRRFQGHGSALNQDLS